MTDIDIRRLDLTLLLVLATLLRKRSATAAAQQLGVTQSSISHSLAKLRDIFDDELFIRQPAGLEPTARALSLLPAIEQIIDLTRQAVRPKPFDPSTEQGLVRISGTDYPCALLAAPLLQRLGRDAPDVQVSFRPLVRRGAVAGLVSGEIDMAIGLFGSPSDQFISTLLWQDDYAVVARAGHPTIGKKCSASAYKRARHVLVSLDGGVSGVVDHALAAADERRNVVAAVPYYLTALATVAHSDAISTMPGAIARAYAPQFRLRVFPCPVPIRPLRISLLSSRRRASDQLTDYVRGLILAIVREEIAAKLSG